MRKFLLLTNEGTAFNNKNATPANNEKRGRQDVQRMSKNSRFTLLIC